MDELKEINGTQWPAVIIAIAATVIFSLVYERWFMAGAGEKKIGAAAKPFHAIRLFVIRKFTGLLLFGFLPFLIMIMAFQDVPTGWLATLPQGTDWIIIIGCVVLTVTAGAIGSKQDKVRLLYPEMRISTWRPYFFGISIGGWFIYLAGYEFLFRGFLLHLSIPALGVPLAVTLNVILYSLLHWKKSIREAIGAIPFGVVLCLVMMHTGSLLAPVLVHLGLSASTEVFSFMRNPGMKLIGNER